MGGRQRGGSTGLAENFAYLRRILYRFDLAEAYIADYAMISWYNAHHPNFVFVNGFLVGRPGTDRHYTLSGTTGGGADLAVYHLDGHSERRELNSPP